MKGFFPQCNWAVAALAAVVGASALAALPPVEIVVGRDAKPCRSPFFHQPVAIYRDPSLFLGAFAAYVADPRRGLDELLRERPLLTRIAGPVSFREVGDPRAFHSFPIIQQMYGDIDRRFLAPTAPKIVSVILCGQNNPYRDTIGFAVKADLDNADRPEGGLPPSIEPNPVPTLPPSLMAPGTEQASRLN